MIKKNICLSINLLKVVILISLKFSQMHVHIWLLKHLPIRTEVKDFFIKCRIKHDIFNLDVMLNHAKLVDDAKSMNDINNNSNFECTVRNLIVCGKFLYVKNIFFLN